MPGQGPLLPILGADPNTPTAVSLVGRYALGVDWQDRHGSIYPFAALRGACPCAACRGTGAEAPAPPEAWPVEILREAGALRIRWQDGHETVLPYPDLRRLCRCAACTGGH
jgi:DUF971 family protein